MQNYVKKHAEHLLPRIEQLSSSRLDYFVTEDELDAMESIRVEFNI